MPTLLYPPKPLLPCPATDSSLPFQTKNIPAVPLSNYFYSLKPSVLPYLTAFPFQSLNSPFFSFHASLRTPHLRPLYSHK